MGYAEEKEGEKCEKWVFNNLLSFDQTKLKKDHSNLTAICTCHAVFKRVHCTLSDPVFFDQLSAGLCANAVAQNRLPVDLRIHAVGWL